MRPKAVVLVSGGLDSAVTLAIARQRFTCHALSFQYGERHIVELQAAEQIARRYAEEHRVISFDLFAQVGGSALTSTRPVPKDRSLEQMGQGIPSTYVPARNTIFLSFALAWAEVLGARDIFIGANQIDYSGYPDCRARFFDAFEKVADEGTRPGQSWEIHAPLLHDSKARVVERGTALGVDFALTRSCYDPVGDQGLACGRCDSCQIRRRGFEAAGVVDPTRYAR